MFLKNVMIREGGLFVLMGSKPMSTFPIDNGYPETEEESKKYYVEYLTLLKKENSSSLLTYEDFSEKCKNNIHLHTRSLWDTWQKRMKNYVGPRYQFVVRKSPFGQGRQGGLFINIPNTLLTLKCYYQEFAEIYGAPFDPEQVLNEIGNENSSFWEHIFQSNYAQGLLLGYGRNNSFAFSWQITNHLSFFPITNKEQQVEPLLKSSITLSDLPLPPICVYSVGDRVLANYKKERKEILKQFQGKDFETLTKEWLQHGLVDSQ